MENNCDNAVSIYDDDESDISSDTALTNTNKDFFECTSPQHLSFLSHAVGIRLLESIEVCELYNELKSEHLSKNTDLGNEDIKNCIQTAWVKVKLNPQRLNSENFSQDIISEDNIISIETLLESVLQDRRDFMSAFLEKKMNIFLREFCNPTEDVSLQEIPQDNVFVANLIYEVYTDCGYEGYSDKSPSDGNIGRFIHQATAVRTLLQSYEPNDDLKKLIKEKILQLPERSRLKYKTFIANIRKEPREVIIRQSDLILDQFAKEIYGTMASCITEKVERKTLPNSFPIIVPSSRESDGRNLIQDLLAFVRLMTLSDKRLIRNLQDQTQFRFGDEETVSRSIQFMGIEKLVTESHKLNFNTGSRSDLIDNLSTYEHIAETIGKIKQISGLSDKEIATRVRETLLFPDKRPKVLNGLKKIQRAYVDHFIISFTYLLFGTEVSRNPSSLIIHSMVLDLIEDENSSLSWEDAIKRLPMAMKGAVEFSRKKHKEYSLDKASSYKYDNSFVDDFDFENIRSFIETEIGIINDWLAFKNLDANIDWNTFLALLVKQSVIWFNIHLSIESIQDRSDQENVSTEPALTPHVENCQDEEYNGDRSFANTDHESVASEEVTDPPLESDSFILEEPFPKS